MYLEKYTPIIAVLMIFCLLCYQWHTIDSLRHQSKAQDNAHNATFKELQQVENALIECHYKQEKNKK